MKYIKNLKKRTIIIASIVLAVVVIAVVLSFILLRGGESQEKKLENLLKDIGTEFYEEFYYKQIASDDEKRTEFLKKYKDIGIKVSLDNLSRYKKEEESSKILKPFVNSETKEECDKTNTMVIVYPKEPYGQTDYTIDTNLVCGYEKENNQK